MENRNSVDQRRCEALRLLAERADLFRRKGVVLETWRQRAGQRLGPYYRLAYRDGGVQRSLYLGADPALAAEVRAELARLQAPARDNRRLERQKKILRQALVRQRALWNQELRPLGLFLKGSEVRGWRSRAQSN